MPDVRKEHGDEPEHRADQDCRVQLAQDAIVQLVGDRRTNQCDDEPEQLALEEIRGVVVERVRGRTRCAEDHHEPERDQRSDDRYQPGIRSLTSPHARPAPETLDRGDERFAARFGRLEHVERGAAGRKQHDVAGLRPASAAASTAACIESARTTLARLIRAAISSAAKPISTAARVRDERLFPARRSRCLCLCRPRSRRSCLRRTCAARR